MSIYEQVIADLEEYGCKFRINDLDETLEVQMSADHDWERYNDTHDDIITLEMQEMGYGSDAKKIALSTLKRAITKHADANRFNPVKDYFVNLDLSDYQPEQGEHGPQPHVIRDFAKHFTNPDQYFGVWLFKWMVGAIAKVFMDERNPMLVLTGAQNEGKSSFAEWICPVEGRFIRGAISPDSKDHRLRLSQVFVWEADELEGTTLRQKASSLKSFITLQSIYERPPFKKHPMQKPAITSFIGTYNPDGAGFLNDPTGSSRYLITELDKIDWRSYIAHFTPDDLWQEAYWFFRHRS